MNHEYIKEQKTANVFPFILDANDFKVQIFWEEQKKSKKIFPLLLTFLSKVQIKWKIFLNFMAFSKYMNFLSSNSSYKHYI